LLHPKPWKSKDMIENTSSSGRAMAGVFGKTRKNSMGFTLVELLTTIGMITILCLIAIPTFTAWLPNYRLKQAARDLYSNLQRTKIGAIKANESWGIWFESGAGRYRIYSLGPNRTWENGGGDDEYRNITINLSSYKGVNFGHGTATNDVDGHVFADNITYKVPDGVAVFSNRGTVVNPGGYVYLSNTKGTAYAVGTPNPAGVVVMRKFSGGIWK
jgi:Tfp pilus assembly protein FimT